MELLSRITRFRAYQIDQPGSLFSYFDGSQFTLIDVNITEKAEASLVNEIKGCQKTKIDKLHITSWDNDHCSKTGLEKALKYLKPEIIDLPGYPPDSQTGKECLDMIETYKKSFAVNGNPAVNLFTPEYKRSLTTASSYSYTNVLYHPDEIGDKHNDNSTVMLFRTGAFTVLSLGDVESPEIARKLMNSSIFCNEIDVMILAHHGADNGFTTSEFLNKSKPKIAVCTADYDNQHNHPRQEIRDILFEEGVRLYTTKTGDVIVYSIGEHKGECTVLNLKSGSTDISSTYDFKSKRYETYYSFLLKSFGF